MNAKKKLKLQNDELPTSTEVKTEFGKYFLKAQKDPVVFKKNNEPAGVLISFEQFEKYQAMEDSYWHNRAVSEGKEMLGTKKSKEFFDDL
jgi:prevent-host-death family protein